MSLFDPSATGFLAFPLPPDVPISNQPAFGDNLGWNNFQEDHGYDYWAESGQAFDDSWAWDARKEPLWSDLHPTHEDVLISVRPTTATQRRQGQAERPEKRKRAEGDALEHDRDVQQSREREQEELPLGDVDFDFSSFPLEEFAGVSQTAAVPPALPVPSPMQDGIWEFPDTLEDKSQHHFPPLGVPLQAAQFPIDTVQPPSNVYAEHDSFVNAEVMGHQWSENELQFLGLDQSPSVAADVLDGVTDTTAHDFMDLTTDTMDENMASLEPDCDSPAQTATESVRSPAEPVDRDHLVSCSTCFKVVKRRKLRDHMRWHIKNAECQVCHKSFATDKDLRRHQKQHTGDKPFKCEVPGCKYADLGFARVDNLRRHIKKVHDTPP